MSIFKSWRSYWDFSGAVHNRARYVRDEVTDDFLAIVRETAQAKITTLEKESYLWRAQLGHDWGKDCDPDGNEWDVEVPYPPKRMRPLRDRAREGRANPKGIPYLYLATTKDTALAEARPWIGSLISCAVFRIARDLKLLDCMTPKPNHRLFFGDGPAEARERCVWGDISSAFARPVSPTDDVADYVPTQIISELVKADGFDGIIYRSALSTDGKNVVLFDLNAATMINCGLFTVETMQFNFKASGNPCSLLPEKDDGTTKK